MSRKTDEELLEEIEERRKIKKEVSEDKEEEIEEDSSPQKNKVETQVIEREVNLSLINDKLNFIISKLQK